MFSGRGVSEAYAVKCDFAARRRRPLRGILGRNNLGLDREKLGDAPRGAGGRGDFVPHLRELAKRSRGEYGKQHELREQAAAHASREHVVGAEPQHADDAEERQRDGNRDEERARHRHRARRVIGPFDSAGKTRARRAFFAVSLHGRDRGEVFGGVGAGFCKQILGVARAPAHQPPRCDQRRHDGGDRDHHHQRKLWARRRHQRRRTDKHDEVAQRDRSRGAEGGLDLGRIGGEPRHQFAGARAVVEGGVEFGEMSENVGAKIGDDALAERGDQIVARRGGERDRQHCRGDREKVGVDGAAARLGKAVIDHPSQREGHSERARRRDQERKHGETRAAALLQSIARQRNERTQRRARRAIFVRHGRGNSQKAPATSIGILLALRRRWGNSTLAR